MNMQRLLPVLLARRPLNLLALAACIGAIATALLLQHLGAMEPCPLCIFQRMAVIACAAVLLMAVIHDPGTLGTRVYGALTAVGAAIAAGIAIRHLWLQSLPPHALPACGPDLGYMLDSFPFHEALSMVFAGAGDCAEPEFFLGLTVPGWTLVLGGGLLAVGLFQLVRPAPKE